MQNTTPPIPLFPHIAQDRLLRKGKINLKPRIKPVAIRWERTCKTFRGDDGKFMPIGLVIFGDKTHTDLHGALSVTPIIFTLTCFNRYLRNKPEFWRPLAYIPNLSHGKCKADDKNSMRNLCNEYKCLAATFEPIIKLHERNGFGTTVRGKSVVCKIWIHFFIGDIEGNNNVVGLVVQRIRGQHSKWMVEYGKVTVKDLIKWIKVYAGDIHISMWGVREMIKRLNGYMRSYVSRLESDRSRRILTMFERGVVNYCRRELDK